MEKVINKKTPLKDIWSYAIGEGGTSIAINGISNFAMIFYTQVLGLAAGYAGLALGITTFWDAVSDPIMGHISDNTKSKYGRRHLYMFVGGILLALSFLFLWYVPGVVRSNTTILFFYLLMVNLILRTALTIYVVPYTALGFEICTEYEGRSKLQGVRYFLNMVINFIFGAAAWSLFFRDGVKADGSRLDGTMIASNYLVMGAVLSVTAFILITICCILTKKYIIDSRKMKLEGNSLKAFFHDIWTILKDKHAQKIFIFLAFAQLGMLLTSQLQIFAYVDFMKFTSFQKTFVHGSTMVGFALGALAISQLVKFFEKRSVAYIGSVFCVLGGVFLFIIFTGGIIKPGGTESESSWIAALFFAFGQFMFWGGCGIIIPLATSMIADISEINKYQTGLLKDGSYSAMFSFILKASTSIGLAITGILLSFTGYIEGVNVQTYAVAKNIASWSFLSGPVLIILAGIVIFKYPITRKFLESIREE